MPSAKRQRLILSSYLSDDKPNSDDEFRLLCPFHFDSRPSANINFDKGVWYCHPCDIGGTVNELVKKIEAGDAVHDGTNDKKLVDINKARRKRGSIAIEPISLGAVEGWHAALESDPNHLNEIRETRGLTIETLNRFRIGYDHVNSSFYNSYF